MITGKLGNGVTLSGVQYSHGLFYELCVSYQKIELQDLLLEPPQLSEGIFSESLGRRQKSFSWQGRPPSREL